MKTIGGWLFAGILLAILMYVQFCGTGRTVIKSANNEALVKSLKKQTADTVKYYEELLKADSSAIETAVAHAEVSAGKQQQAEADLIKSKSQVAVLTAKLREARNEEPADDWVKVSPRYVINCDSLEIVAEDQDIKIARYVVTTKELEKSVLVAKEQYDKKIQHQKDFNTALQNQLDTCHNQLSKQPEEKRTQLYVGGDLLGNKQKFIDGGILSLTLLTKKNTMFQVSGALINGEPYAGVGTKVLISFRRRR